METAGLQRLDNELYYNTIFSMTVLLQTRLPRPKAARFKAAAHANGKSVYQALRELAENYAEKSKPRKFECLDYDDRFALPSPSRSKEELRNRIRRRHEKSH
jgi:hypothetical protein